MVLRVGVAEIGGRVGEHLARAAGIGLDAVFGNAVQIIVRRAPRTRWRRSAPAASGSSSGVRVGDLAEILEGALSRRARRRRRRHTCARASTARAAWPCSAAYSQGGAAPCPCRRRLSAHARAAQRRPFGVERRRARRCTAVDGAKPGRRQRRGPMRRPRRPSSARPDDATSDMLRCPHSTAFSAAPPGWVTAPLRAGPTCWAYFQR